MGKTVGYNTTSGFFLQTVIPDRGRGGQSLFKITRIKNLPLGIAA